MTEPLVTWSAEHEADYQRRLLAAFRHVYRAHATLPLGLRGYTVVLLDCLRERMSDRTRLRASQWERALWKKESKR